MVERTIQIIQILKPKLKELLRDTYQRGWTDNELRIMQDGVGSPHARWDNFEFLWREVSKRFDVVNINMDESNE